MPGYAGLGRIRYTAAMLVKAKCILSRLPVVGYGLHWIVDVLTLPLIRRDLLQQIRHVQQIQQQNSALRRSFDDAFTQLDFLYNRIMSMEGTELRGEPSISSNAEFRADMLKRLWATDRRLGEIERQLQSHSNRVDVFSALPSYSALD